MGKYIAKQVMKLMIKKDIILKNSNVLLMGFTFKENCPDTRNTRVIDIYDEFLSLGIKPDIWDPCANPQDVLHEYGLVSYKNENDLKNNYDAIILAVSHDQFKDFDIFKIRSRNSIVYDVKGFLSKQEIDERL
jgi:UDP-N-acetyl-D-galactosamine dehydrogenase